MDGPRLLDVHQGQPLRQRPNLLYLLLVSLRIIIIAPLFIERLDNGHVSGWLSLFLNLLILLNLIIALIDVKVMRLIALRLEPICSLFAPTIGRI